MCNSAVYYMDVPYLHNDILFTCMKHIFQLVNYYNKTITSHTTNIPWRFGLCQRPSPE